MLKQWSPHSKAVLQALFITFLWSTSWIFIKFGLREQIPPLIFAGLRYSLAFLCLLVVALRPPTYLTSPAVINRRSCFLLTALGLLYYAVTQGTIFVGLQALPAVTVNLLLSFISALVALLGIVTLGERPVLRQWWGIGLYLVGALVFFYPIALPDGAAAAVGIVLVGMAANAISSLLARSINRQAALTPLLMTVISMGIGSSVLLAAGLLSQGLPRLVLQSWLIIGWLAVVNTAFAFTLWNHTLRTLSALESPALSTMR